MSLVRFAETVDFGHASFRDMIRIQLLPVAITMLALTGCATGPSVPSPVPSDREVVAYVRANWDAYDARLAFLSGRRGQSPTLVSVSNVECAPDGSDARCTLDVEGRFEDGTVVKRAIESLFQRQTDGSIEMLIPVVRG